MDFTTEIKRINELETEAKQLQKRIKEEVESKIKQLFYDNGFVVDPRDGVLGEKGIYEGRGFYDPKTRISVWFGGVLKKHVRFSVYLRAEDGIDWEGINPAGYTNWSYKEESFEEFLKETFQKRVDRCIKVNKN
tara:strand:- start:37 stop:438 length:402 start_codon:yes stop_codon:yes gene_type:complete